MQALFDKLGEAARNPVLRDSLEQFSPGAWMTYKEVVDNHDRIREWATTYGQSTTVKTNCRPIQSHEFSGIFSGCEDCGHVPANTEIRRYEYDGLTLECDECDHMLKQTVVDANSDVFSKIEFCRLRGRGDLYIVHYKNLTETLLYKDSYTMAQIGVSLVELFSDRAVFSTHRGRCSYELVVKNDNSTSLRSENS